MSSSRDEFCPFLKWQCPHCLEEYSQNAQNDTQLTVLRGTCCHDVCHNCITKIVSRRNLVKSGAATRRAVKNASRIEVSCPIDKCSYGKFNVDREQISSDQRRDEVIDLCDDERDQNKQKHNKAGAVKKEVNVEQLASRSRGRAASIKKEKHVASRPAAANATTETSKPDTDISKHNVASPLPVKKLSNLKPLFAVGDEVFAAWWDDPNDDSKRQGKASWYPGKVKSYKTTGIGRYGPNRLYHVRYEDGDELDKLEDCWVFPKKDYQLTIKFEKMGWKPIGVKKKFDRQSNDAWAKKVGWYEVTVDGEDQSFSLLSDAMKAHDTCVIKKHGSQTKKSYLNMPEDCHWLFSDTKIEVSEGGASATSMNVVSPMMSGLSVKNEPNAKNENGVSTSKDQSDEESRFSDESVAEDEGEEWREVKRRRLDLSRQANVENTEFWSVNREHIEFTRQAFVAKSIFHLNSFVNGKKKENQAFALFLREGVATPGFDPIPTTIDIDRIAGWSYSQLREALVQYGGEWGASQTAMWLKNATVGSFVIMRHEYPKCQFCPGRLKDESGKYIGPVYVIGVITKKVVPWSAEERAIAENRMSEFSNHHWDIHNVCRVSWRRMGYKKTLKEETQNYMNHVCQPTLQRICDDFKKVYTGGATSESIRRDLWANATIPIRSDEFPDKFDHIDPREDE